jgi:GR25 family glycosyltransferase involved in LPS biosynthesis
MKITPNVILYFIVLIVIIGLIYYVTRTIKEGFEKNAKKYLDGVDIIYWINLERSSNRKKDMEKMLQDEVFDGIPKQRIIAYDGKTNIDSVFNKYVIENKNATDLEYACLLSHLETIRTFNETPYNVALIFEDDVTLEFKKYWRQSVKEIIENAPEDWDIILLGYTKTDLKSWNNVKMYEKLINGNYFSTLSYLVNKKCCKKLLENYKNNKYYLDKKYQHSSDIYMYKITNVYVYKYPYFTYETNNESTIHQDHVPDHDLSKRLIQKNYDNMGFWGWR